MQKVALLIMLFITSTFAEVSTKENFNPSSHSIYYKSSDVYETKLSFSKTRYKDQYKVQMDNLETGETQFFSLKVTCEKSNTEGTYCEREDFRV